MSESIWLFKRNNRRLDEARFAELAKHLGLKSDSVQTEHALAQRDGTRTVAYAQPCAKFAGLLFFADQSVSWGDTSSKPVGADYAKSWTTGLLKRFELLPADSPNSAIKLNLEIVAAQSHAVVFDGKERRRVAAATNVTSKITLNGIDLVGPRAKVRALFKSGETPLMLHVGLWESLTVHEERERVRENDAVRAVRDALAKRGDSGVRAFRIRELRLVYVSEEYQGGPDLIAPEYLAEVEIDPPRRKDEPPRVDQAVRQIIRIPAYR